MQIRSRNSWRATRPRPRTRQFPAQIGELFVHWNGTEPRSFQHVNTVAEEENVMRGTQAFHMGPQRGWADFAYSFAIFPSGRIYRGRGLRWVPASQLGHNTNTVSVIVFLGPDDTIPDAVKASVKALHRYVDDRSARKVALKAHRDATSTDCPGAALTAMVRAID